MAIKMNVIKADLRRYPHFVILGESKVGKTTLFRDLVLYNYKDPKRGLLISLGNEEGYHALDKLQYEDITEWDKFEDEEGNRGFIQVVDDLVENKKSLGIEMIGIDTLDELVKLAEDEVFEIHRRKYNKYPVSIKAALGGYQEGPKKAISLVMDQISRINRAGYAVFIFGHTKRKDKEDIYTGYTYEEVTNDLMSTYFSPIENSSQMVVNIVKESDFSDVLRTKEVQAKKNGDEKEEVEVRRKIGETRMMYFMGTGYVHAGTRFPKIVEKLPLSAENFMKAFEDAVKNSLLDDAMTEEEYDKRKKNDQEVLTKEYEKAKEKEENEKIKEEETQYKYDVLGKFKEAAMNKSIDAVVLKKIKTLNEKYKVSSYDDVDLVPIELIKELDELISK